MPKDQSIKSVLLIGSGPIVIGQACEFDYSGSQASRSLRNEGIEVTLINSNPATIMTDPVTADNVYLMPLTTESIEKILAKHKIDAVLPTMGGQTALNLCIDCDKAGIWEHYGVKIIGVDINAIETTEDREKFRLKMLEIGVGVCKGATATSFLEGKEIAQATFKALGGQLQAALAEGGVEQAIAYCNVAAYPITDSLSLAYHARVRRTALKYRNPRNAPIPAERLVLEEYALRKSGGEELTPRVMQLGEDSVAFYAPILMQPLCVTCHGIPGETMAVETQTLVQQYYAQDQAVGFGEGDLRGMWSIKFARE